MAYCSETEKIADCNETEMQRGLKSNCNLPLAGTENNEVENRANGPNATNDEHANKPSSGRIKKRDRVFYDCSPSFPDKRKVPDEENSDNAIVKAKRKYKPAKISSSNSSSEDGSDTLTMKSAVGGDSDSPNSSMQFIASDKDVSPQEIEELRKNLEEGFFQNYFSLTFWKSLHANHGSTLGYTFGFLLILFLNYHWMLEEFADSTEGHSVAKTFVILFVIYSYSFISLGLEFIQLGFLILELNFPKYFKRLQQRLNTGMESCETLKKFRSSKYFYTPAVVLLCMGTAFIGSILWKWFWWNHICKSYHDRTCRGSWLGQLVISYRDEACYDGTASSMICERFVSYLPIMLFSVFFVFLGNVFMPLLNDRLSTYYPFSETLDAAFDLMDQLGKKSFSNLDNPKGLKEFTTQQENYDYDKQNTPQSKQKWTTTLRRIVPTSLGVIFLLLLDWMIVKKFFP